jgi:hypothetical protein
MAAARTSLGVLSQDNWNLGFSGGFGRTLDTMGYKLRDAEPKEMALAGADLTLLRDRLEHRFDLLAGRWLGEATTALFYRFGVNLAQEGRLKIELQPSYWRTAGQENYQLSLGLSALATSDLTLRIMYTYDHVADDNRVIFQLYYYTPL